MRESNFCRGLRGVTDAFVFPFGMNCRRLVASLLGLITMAPLAVGAPDKGSVLSDSIKPVTAAPNATVNPGQPFISRDALTPDEANAYLDFEVTLKMRNMEDLQARLGRGDHISPAEMAEKYEPRKGEYQAVLEWLIGDGFTITRRDSQHISIFVRGKIGQIAHAFHVKFARVSCDGKDYSAAVSPPEVPTTIAPLLVGINGLQPYLRMH